MQLKVADAPETLRCPGKPLVSVGIPTFNRPDGLHRPLRLSCSQTYPYLEILVSDNGSPGPETERIVREFSKNDKRVRYFRQPTNIGPLPNFRFVLAKASGDHFMWAADDDEWDANFIETCLSASGPACSVMTKFDTIFRARNVLQESRVPILSPGLSVLENAENYLSNMQPSLIYGLHPRKSILFALSGPNFDFYDCYFVFRIILESNFLTIDERLYGAGVDTPSRQVKYANGSSDRKRLEFWPFFRHSAVAVLRCSRLSNFEKTRLVIRLARSSLALRKHHRRRE